MNVVAVIPARYASTRFPGKMLADLNGKPMIQHVWEHVRQAKMLDDVLIATDDARVEAAAKKFGARVVMTPPELPSGTDRVAYAVRDLDVQVVINVQGDEPMMHPQMPEALAALMLGHPHIPMSTLKRPLRDPRESSNPNVVKVVTDSQGWALYFSRAGIPYARNPGEGPGWFKHLGIYAYQHDFLRELVTWPPSGLERAESLEQLRVLEHGTRIMVLETPHDSVGVDTPEDLKRVAERMTGAAHA